MKEGRLTLEKVRLSPVITSEAFFFEVKTAEKDD